VTKLAFSPDGKTLASGGTSLSLWDLATGRRRDLSVNTGGECLDLAFSADGTMLTADFGVRGPQLWDVRTGRYIRVGQAWESGGRLTLSPDGKAGAVLTAGTVHLWDIASDRRLSTLEPGEDDAPIFALTFTADGKSLVTLHTNRAVSVWDLPTGKDRRQFAFPTRSAVLSPDGRTALGVEDRRVVLWELTTGRRLREFRAERPVEKLTFTADGRIVAAGESNGRVELWEASTGKPLGRVECRHRLTIDSAIALSPDGKTLAVNAGRSIALFEVATGQEHFPEGHRSVIDSVGYSPTGRTVITGSDWDKTVRFWDAATGQEIRTIAVTERMGAVNLTPDGRTIAWPNGEGDSQTVRIGSLKDSATGNRFEGHRVWRDRLAFSADGSTLVTRFGQALSVWDLRSGRLRHVLETTGVSGPNQGGVNFALAPDGRTLAVTPDSVVIRIWDTATGRPRVTLHDGEARSYHGLIGLPGGNRAVSVSQYREMTVRIWDALSGRQLWSFPVSDCQVAAFSPDGRVLAASAGGKSITLWEVATGGVIADFQASDDSLFAGDSLDGGVIAFAPDGRTFTTAHNSSCSALVWDGTGLGPSGSQPRGDLTAEELAALWADLAEPDAARGNRAVWRLAAAAGQAVPFIRGRLRPAVADPQQVRVAVERLGSDQFAVRQQATRELEELGELAAPELRRIADSHPSIEFRGRVSRLLRRLGPQSPVRLRAVRAVAVLEHAGTPMAREVLRSWCEGAADAWLTQEAVGARERLAARASPPGRE
jgi:WD40 repeat protein